MEYRITEAHDGKLLRQFLQADLRLSSKEIKHIKFLENGLTVNGERVTYGQTATNRYIGYLPDVPEFYSFMSAEEYLRFSGEISGLSKEENEQRCKELLALVGLSDEKHRIKGFSRGMKQRLGIAVALIGNPDFIVLDEPINGLDPQGIVEIRELILKLNKEKQITVLISSHYYYCLRTTSPAKKIQ